MDRKGQKCCDENVGRQSKGNQAIFLKGSMMNNVICCLIVFVSSVGISVAQNFKVAGNGTFRQKDGSTRKVLLFQDSSSNRKMVLFQTNLQVNTDGTPMSYHPFDPLGDSIALNRIDNAIVVYKSDKTTRAKSAETISVFRKWRDSNYEVVPDSSSIVWKNVLISEKIDGKDKPCIFTTGEYKGYYSSATSLTNGLTTNRGECDCNNQANPLKIPGLVLAGGNNVVRKFGAKIGDLVIAYNPGKKRIVCAIVNDGGPPDNLGEGSVLLNMKLLDKKEYPKRRRDTYGLATGNGIVITIIPDSKSYHEARPYTAENINQRINKWLIDSGFGTEEKFMEFLEQIRSKLS